MEGAAGASGTGGSGGSAGGEAYTGPGTVTDAWGGFCVVTFSRLRGEGRVPKGPAYGPRRRKVPRHQVQRRSSDAGAELTFPFTASCAPNPPHSYFAVFADVSVFAEPQLVTKICDLKNGATVTLDGAKQAGYANAPGAGTSFLYEIFLNAFSAQCGGAENGHIRVRSINALGTAQTLVPFEVIAAEK